MVCGYYDSPQSHGLFNCCVSTAVFVFLRAVIVVGTGLTIFGLYVF